MFVEPATLPPTIAPPRQERGRTLCGWCNRVVALEGPPGTVRHVTCDDCRSLASTWTSAAARARDAR